MDLSGFADPCSMARHYFGRATGINHETALRANPAKQNHGYMWRDWYMDATFACQGCGLEFTWTANEQKVWFEDYFFWVDSEPRRCIQCRAAKRALAVLRREYDANIGEARRRGSFEQKMRIVEIITELETDTEKIPCGIRETKLLFERQLKNMAKRPGNEDRVGPSVPTTTIPRS